MSRNGGQRCLRRAYKVASSNAGKNAESRKRQYDKKVKHALLHQGDRILVRNLSERGGSGKLRSFMNVVVGRKGRTRVLHRNLLLPCSHLPTEEEHTQQRKPKKNSRGPTKQASHGKATKRTTVQTEVDDPEDEESGFTPQTLEALYTAEDNENREFDDNEADREHHTETSAPTSTSQGDGPTGQEEESAEDDSTRRRPQRVSRPPNRVTYDYLGQPSIQPCVTAGVQGMTVAPQQWWRPSVFQWYPPQYNYAQPYIPWLPCMYYPTGTVYS
ncbi:hypothetical protein QZH41_001300 [Actinostola sp. cb2023]|nr:hypothetical protein QZH41_001300 [Actinostola sp. cb2023]